MAVKILTEQTSKKVNLLKDVDAEFVSLVKHGANRMPFRVVKSQSKKGGDKDTMTLSIQSIVIPKGKELDDLTKIAGLEYLSEADTANKSEHDGYIKYNQVDPKLFDSDSMQIIKAGDGFLIVGLMSEKSDKQILSISQEQVEKLADIPLSPMDSVVGDPDVAAQAAMVSSFREMFDRELYSMIDIVTGNLRQTSGDPKKRKNAIIAAVDAFKNFLSLGLDAIGQNAAKVSKVEFVSEEKQQNNGGMEMFKDKEEFTTAVQEIVNKTIDEKLPDAVGNAVTGALEKFEEKIELKFKQTGDDNASDDATDDNSDAKDKNDKSDKNDPVAKLAESVSALTEKVEKLMNEPDTDSGAADSDDPAKAAEKADDKNKEPEPERKYKGRKREHDLSVFSGLLTRKRTKAA